MVHDDVAEGQGQDRKGRDAARACEADEDVQLPGIQGYVGPSVGFPLCLVPHMGALGV